MTPSFISHYKKIVHSNDKLTVTDIYKHVNPPHNSIYNPWFVTLILS